MEMREMLTVGTEVLGYWGPMHPYDDGVVVDADEKYLTIDWGHATGAVQLIRHEDIKGQWYRLFEGENNGLGVYDATL